MIFINENQHILLFTAKNVTMSYLSLNGPTLEISAH